MTIAEMYAAIEDATGHAVTEDTAVDSLGLDSLEFVELTSALSSLSGKDISDADIAEAKTVGELVEAFC